MQTGSDGELLLDSPVAGPGDTVSIAFCGTSTIEFADRPFRAATKKTNEAFAAAFDEAFK